MSTNSLHIRRRSKDSPNVGTVIGKPGVRGFEEGTSPLFSCLRGVCVSSEGSVYLCDGGDEDVTLGNHVVLKIDLKLGVSTVLAGSGKLGFKEGKAYQSMLNWPVGLCLLRDESALIIADSDNQAIRQLDLKTNELTTITGSPNNRGYYDGLFLSCRFSSPVSVAVNDGDDVFVTDLGNRVIRQLHMSCGWATTLAGQVGKEGIKDGVGSEALFLRPKYVTTDPSRRTLFLTDAECVRKIEVNTRLVVTIAGSPLGQAGYVDSAIPSEVRFDDPRGIAVDGRQNIFVSDLFNDCVRKISPTGATETFAGHPDDFEEDMFEDGSSEVARFDTPTGIAIHPITGELIVNDYENCVLRKISHTGATPPLQDLWKASLAITRFTRLLNISRKDKPSQLSEQGFRKQTILKVMLDCMKGQFFDSQQLQELQKWASTTETLNERKDFLQCFRGAHVRKQNFSNTTVSRFSVLKRKLELMDQTETSKKFALPMFSFAGQHLPTARKQ